MESCEAYRWPRPKDGSQSYTIVAGSTFLVLPMDSYFAKSADVASSSIAEV